MLNARADEPQSLDQFLARLGLSDLRLANRERTLARETVPAKRLELARKLADAYSEELVTAADEPERFAALKLRVEKLLSTVPDARTPAVEVILLQAESQRAEALMQKHDRAWQQEWLRCRGLPDWAEYYQEIDKYQESVCAKAS